MRRIPNPHSLIDFQDFDDTFMSMSGRSKSFCCTDSSISQSLQSLHSMSTSPPLTKVSNSRPLKFYKRAQILIADLWACFGNTPYGYFTDIDKISMFARLTAFHKFYIHWDVCDILPLSGVFLVLRCPS